VVWGGGRVENTVKGVIGALLGGDEEEMGQYLYLRVQRAAGLKINPCRDLCNIPRGW